MLVAGVFLYLSLFVWPATPRLLVWDDQFINFDNARRMLEGQRLYADIFQYTLPGTELLEMPLIKIFGPKLALIDALVVAAGVGCAGLALAEASAVLGQADAILASLLFVTLGFHSSLEVTHHKFSVFFVYAATLVVTRSRSRPRLKVAGALLGLATCFTQTRALVALALGLFVAWENRRKAPADRDLLRDELSLFIPFGILVGLACAFVIWNGGLEHLYRDVIRFTLVHYTAGDANNWGSAFADWAVVGSWSLWASMKLLVPGIYLVFLVYRWVEAKHEREEIPVELVLLSVIGITLYLTVAYAPLHVRLSEISMPAMIVTVWLLNRTGERLWRIPAWAVGIAYLLVLPTRAQFRSYVMHDTPAGRIAVSDHDLSGEMTWLKEHTHSGDEFFAAYTTRLYVVLGLRNPARVPFVEPDDYTRPRQVVNTVRSIRRAKPQFILWPFEPQDADDPMDRLYLLGEELRSCYKPLLRLYDGEVWQRKKDGCESADRQLGLGNPVPALSDRGVGG